MLCPSTQFSFNCRASAMSSEISEPARMVQTAQFQLTSPPSAHPKASQIHPGRVTQLSCPSITSQAAQEAVPTLHVSPWPMPPALLRLTSLLWMCCLGTEMGKPTKKTWQKGFVYPAAWGGLVLLVNLGEMLWEAVFQALLGPSPGKTSCQECTCWC